MIDNFLILDYSLIIHSFHDFSAKNKILIKMNFFMLLKVKILKLLVSGF